MLFLDTHIVVWIFAKRLDLLSEKGRNLIENQCLYISPFVQLELEYLYEIGRIKHQADKIFNYLTYVIGLEYHQIDLQTLINIAIKETWTRDPFDRLIVSHCRYCDANLISKDISIQKNYNKTIF